MTHIPRVCLVGIGGYGRVHLQHLLEFHLRGECRLVAAVCLPADKADPAIRALEEIGCELLVDFSALLRAVDRLQLTLAIVPTPIHLHASMTTALISAGLHVLVEKPLAATVPDADRIIASARIHSRTVAVGFQYLHAPEIRELKQRLLAGEIGRLRRIFVHAAWPRSHAYYTRNAWAGRLRVGDDWVLDSPVNNAMSHFFMLMLFLGGSRPRTLATPGLFEAELYRVQAIESFDTAVIRMNTAEGCRLDFYGTHSSASVARPSLSIEGSDGRAEWVQDGFASLEGKNGVWRQDAHPEADTRERMLRDLFAHLRGEDSFICSPGLASTHVRCVAALHRAVPIHEIPKAALAVRHGPGGETLTFLPGLDEVMRAAALRGGPLPAADLACAKKPTAASV